MAQNKLITAVLVVVILGALGGAGYYIFQKPSGTAAPPTPPGIGMPTRMLICDDGQKVPIGMGKPKVENGKSVPYTYTVAGHTGNAYMEYQCMQCGTTWAFGKNGRINCPKCVPNP